MSAIPVPYVGTGSQSQVQLGHYAVSQLSGAIAATPTALDVHARIRWAPTLTTAFCVLMRLKYGYHILTAVTAAVRQSYQASIVRGFTVDFTTAITNINMGTKAKTNTMKGSMANSQMGAAGPGICTTAPLTGHTYTLDNAPFCFNSYSIITGTNATGTVVTTSLGMGSPAMTLYEWTGLGQHPVVLSNQEGVVVELTHTGHATGTLSEFSQWEWAEVFVF